MSPHTEALMALISQLLSKEQQQELQAILQADEFDYDAFYAFDNSLEGPSLQRVSPSEQGRYHMDDRDIFRPFQYVDIAFQKAQRLDDLAWETREIVERSSLHIEALVKRIARSPRNPLGQALNKAKQLPNDLWNQLKMFAKVYNAAKHDMNQTKDTHLFSEQDAVMAYIVARMLGLRLYPYTILATDLAVFDQEQS